MLAQILLAAGACDPQREVCRSGPGAALRIFVIVAVIGIVVTAWLLLRGYRDRDGFDD